MPLCLLQDNYTALHIAVESAKPAVVETLLGYGAEVHVRGNELYSSWPPLLVSTVYSRSELLMVLWVAGVTALWVRNCKENWSNPTREPRAKIKKKKLLKRLRIILIHCRFLAIVK